MAVPAFLLFPDAMIPAIVNTTAGTADAVLKALRDAGAFDVRECEGADIAARVRDAVSEGHARIVVAGGDGTIAAAAGVLVGTSVELAIVPAGTLNHFARDHRIPEDAADAAALARDGSATPADVARVNGRVFLNTSSVGAYVSLVRIREALEPRLGYRLATLVAAVRVFFTMHRFAVEVVIDRERRIFRTPMLFIGVGERELKLPTLGSRVEHPRAGLHVLVVQGRTRGALIALAFEATTRGVRAATRTPHLDAFLIAGCDVTLRTGTQVAADGEVVQMESPLRYELVPGGLRLVRP